MTFSNKIYRPGERDQVPGVFLQAFIKNGDQFFVTELKVYKDGIIDCWGLVDFEGFKEKVRTGRVRTRLPEGARVSMMASGLDFTVKNVSARVEEDEFVKQVADEIRALNQEPTSADLCREALRQYEQDSSQDNLERLRIAYGDVPKHMRMFLGSMDDKDSEYKRIFRAW